ncbi:MAG TPA: hypothetical protein VLG09_05155 [Candidatus Saccharimonadales bacterium]|nr:hypothetical protein [Candidatus Saccharimonadales bacterium]
MKQVEVSLKDCYGIGKLDHTFDFDVHIGGGHDTVEHSQTNIVYARNGVMKTSFAKTLKDYSLNVDPVDNVYQRHPTVKIKADGTDLSRDDVCVLQSNDEYFESEDMAALLSNKEDQIRYAEIMREIDNASLQLFEATAKSMQIRGGAAGVLKLFDANFKNENYNRLARILSMEKEVDNARPELLAVDYKVVDNPKVTTFLDKATTKATLKEYVDTYEKVLEQSKYFKDGLYDYSNALKVQKSLDDNNFMKKGVGNKVVIVTKDNQETTVGSADELKEAYEKDKNQVFSTLEKQAAYEKFDKEISANPDLRSLQIWTRNHKDLVPSLQNLKHTKTLVWQAHFAENEGAYKDLLAVYRGHKDELNELIKRSRSYESEWKSIVQQFKKSFHPKFDIRVRNEEDVVLKSEKPELVFIYKDDRGGADKEVPIQTLTKHIFSTGERRAVYILCMMFEVSLRLKSGSPTLLILDDIADSFDYKNKYAIIEYFYDLSVSANNIHMIVLTHNYDFFRSMRMRCRMHYNTSPKVFIASRDRGAITLRSGVHGNEFKAMKQASGGSVRAFFALVPLARNLIEYKEGYGAVDYATLTKVLHDKSDSQSVTVNDVITIVQANLNGVNLSRHASADPIQDRIIVEADLAVADGQDELLEDKILLAMGIRIKAERFMRDIYAQGGVTLGDESGEQTGRWYEKFRNDYPANASINTLKRVNITTPETIHINSFMFEPIVDMSIDELKELYNDISNL